MSRSSQLLGPPPSHCTVYQLLLLVTDRCAVTVSGDAMPDPHKRLGQHPRHRCQSLSHIVRDMTGCRNVVEGGRVHRRAE
ncbi:hypothetical protein BDR03DRAFT_939011 [Suillus americanus]|nr:hypothetical protein BDR03DRAFT_939011 [Suillus americanus]